MASHLLVPKGLDQYALNLYLLKPSATQSLPTATYLQLATKTNTEHLEKQSLVAISLSNSPPSAMKRRLRRCRAPEVLATLSADSTISGTGASTAIPSKFWASSVLNLVFIWSRDGDQGRLV